MGLPRCLRDAYTFDADSNSVGTRFISVGNVALVVVDGMSYGLAKLFTRFVTTPGGRIGIECVRGIIRVRREFAGELQLRRCGSAVVAAEYFRVFIGNATTVGGAGYV